MELNSCVLTVQLLFYEFKILRDVFTLRPMQNETSFSVIIPSLNEADTIGACLSGIRSVGPDVEIIVVDGGSLDATNNIAKSAGAKVLHTRPCRGLQCNAGARIATGEILVFLHADTLLPKGTFEKLSEIFSRNEVEIGNFEIAFDTRHWLLRLMGTLSKYDAGLFRFGDQGIVVRKTLFNALGGFYEWRLFEDLAFVRKARKKTKIHRFPLRIRTSARRFIRNGIIRQQIINVYYTIQYLLGVSPAKLAEKYYGRKNSSYEACLIIFLRLPEAGKAKTRLAETLGRKAAIQLYCQWVAHLLIEAGKLPVNILKYIYYTPEEARERVESWIGGGFRFQAQVCGDLGSRLQTAFLDQFQKGEKKVIIVATDVPDLLVADIEKAVLVLNEADLVIGPSTDGGYYLIGMTEFHPTLFDNISWSTQMVYKQTLDIADGLGLNVRALRCLDDIDTEEDLRRWQAGLDKKEQAGTLTRNESELKNGKQRF